jgi:hypothetical protein
MLAAAAVEEQGEAVLAVQVEAVLEHKVAPELLAMYIPVEVAAEVDKVHLVEEREAQV